MSLKGAKRQWQQRHHNPTWSWCIWKMPIMYYKGIPVAVKEYKNLSAKDIQHEAALMPRCSHPSLPHIFGVNLTQKPFFLVSCFYGIKNQACTLRHAIYSPAIHFTKHCARKIMFELCQALQHLHMKHLLHWDSQKW